MLQRRLQVLIDDQQHRRVTEAAAARGVSVGAVVREALDRSLAPADERRTAAAEAILAAEPMALGDGDDLLRELDELRARVR